MKILIATICAVLLVFAMAATAAPLAKGEVCPEPNANAFDKASGDTTLTTTGYLLLTPYGGKINEVTMVADGDALVWIYECDASQYVTRRYGPWRLEAGAVRRVPPNGSATVVHVDVMSTATRVTVTK